MPTMKFATDQSIACERPSCIYVKKNTDMMVISVVHMLSHPCAINS